ncbi:Protein of unknown function [Lentzea xinjiangensis]|uniref:DUF3040 domain-containing protein n=1 Tax=Lentzea xinjiangensis TaxID=402600 RepID=A0A1H9VHG0_9PSEU|nr:DUF3040 domain-containing protein [Lentzea xinjiangensis]SES21240.1 Protein of unknown function [Lentzea xinjiangensis]
MLSREEQQRLADIERRFHAAEPDLASALREGPRVHGARRRHEAAVVSAMAGALLVGLGVLLVSTTFALAGVLALTVAACLHVSRSRDA